MKKRILSILLLCCMVLTLLPTTAFAAGELPDVKLSVPTTFDKTVDLTKQKKELKIKDSKTYLIKGSADPNWYFQYRIKIDGKNNTPHIFLDGVRLQAPKDGPAIELYGGASACLYFIGNDSELIGAENFAALQKNKTDGYLRVLVQTGTKLTCEGGRYGAGIGGSKVGIKKFSQGHGMNLHFGSLATDIYGGEILAASGVYGAGIGGGQGGVGEQIYVYSGKLTVRSVSEGAGIGGGQGGPGRFIYIKGGTVNAGSESGGAGIGSGDQDGQNKSEDAHHIEISGGTVEAWSNYAGAGIGGGRGGSGYDISITGGVVRAQGYYGAGIGGGMKGKSGNILIKDTTLTALALPLYPSSDYDYNYQPASAVGRGSKWVHWMTVMQDQEFAMTLEENIKIEASDGKSVRLSATGWQWCRSQREYERGWGTTTELLIGHVDLQRLSLPYAYNYGRVISELELRCEESTHDHEFGWAIRDDCHIWACKKCGARDPAAEMSKQNGKHSPGDWSNQKQLCTVCGHVLERDTKAPVMETLTDGESYTVEDTLDGKPGAYTFTVSDPAASGETSSGIKSVTINGEPQDGPTYRLPAPDGGNNDAGAEYTVVATDNAGNETTATVRTYRWHHTVTFDANGGSEPEDLPEEVTTAMPAKKVLHGSEYYLPECEFIAPENQQFKAWQIDGTEYPVNAPVTVTADITVKALWEDAPPSHEHSYGDWSRDGTNHWHECTDDDCPNREESIKDKAAHVYTDDADTTCDTCGYERTITPPAHEHRYGDWRKDGTNHWHECTDADCPNREESIKDKAAHVYTDDADTTCDTCGYERTITPPAHEHRYGDWRKDGTNHWHECTDADCPNREESIKDKAAHVYDNDADTTCDTCGYERTITPPAHKHRYGDWRKDGTNHWHECTDADCPNREESIKDKTAHVYDNDTDTTCNTCGYERTVTPPAHEHIVTFDGNGGTPSVGSMTTTNQKLPSLPSASRSGSYSFDGWYTEKSGGTKITTATVFHANTTVYAHWTYIGGGGGGYNPPVTYYTLRFETGGGSDIPSVREAYNAYIDLSQYVPTWRGHTFIGWYSESSLTNKVSGVYLTKDMTVYAGWRVDGNPGTGANPFTDVSEKDWFYGDVMFVYENGLMLGTSKTLFSPHGTATRGMMATILWRMEGSPAPKGKNSFTDVEAGKWYADAITWTAENGIFAGYGKDKFGPDDPITREQLAAIFYRYADYKGYDLTVKGNLDKFKDADKITDYAKTAMQWAVGSGLVKGKSGNLLDPQGTATRAEIAAMLHRFIEKYELVQGKAPGGLMGWIDPKRLQIPKTGDSSVLGLWGFSICTSLAGCLALTTWQIRRRREEEALQIIEK